MVKRTITITTILLILTMVVSLIIVFNKSSFAADDDIASGVDRGLSWRITADGVLILGDGSTQTFIGDNTTSTVYDHMNWYSYRHSIKSVYTDGIINIKYNASGMFMDHSSMETADLSGFRTNQMKASGQMFLNCTSLKSLDLSNWDMSKVVATTGMFWYCTSLTELVVNTWDTSNITNMGGMFAYCTSLKSLDLSSWDTSKVQYFNDYIDQYSGYYYEEWGGVEESGLIFYMTPLKKVVLGENFSFSGNNITDPSKKAILPTTTITSYTGKWIREDEAFGPFTAEELRDNYAPNMAGTWIAEAKEQAYAVFDEDTKILNFIRAKEVHSNDTRGTVKSISGVQYNGRIFLINENNTGNNRTWSNIKNIIKKVVFVDEIKPKSTSHWFEGFYLCTEMNLEKLNTSEVVNMDMMFNNCGSLTSLDVSMFNTSKVTTMDHTLNGCSYLTSIDLSNWDVSNVTNLACLFNDCVRLTSINVDGWDTSKVTNTNHMFNCSRLETLDISSFDTSNATNMEWMLAGATSLNSITLGENFSFKGRGITNTPYKPTLPTPPNNQDYTGKWIRQDKVYGPYTPAELRTNYTSIMQGTWIWEETKYSVTYEYSATIPEGASELPAEKTYGIGEEVTVAQNASAPGYYFSGWSRTGTFEMPAENIVITGSFTPRTDTQYKIEHYLEDLNSNTYTLKKTENLVGTTGIEVTAETIDYEGFTFDDSVDGTKLSGNIAGDESLVLKLYYRRNSYNVSYSYTGDIPNDASTIPSDESYKYGAEITVPENATAEGYTFSGWIKDYITMPAQDIEITGYFIEIPKSYSYKVEYFFDGELDDSLDEILNAELDSEISIVPQTPLKHGDKNYTLVSNNHSITVSINEEDNIIEVYYESDVLDYEFETPEGDGIPDRYQIKVIYKVENGKWDDGTIETKIEIVTLKDKNGNLSEEGTGTINVPQVGSKPAEGYIKGLWNREIPSEVFSKDDGKEFIYSYEKVMKADIAEIEGKASNPKTNDVFHRYLTYGGLGILVLILASKIRRKYSRKAKKILY